MSIPIVVVTGSPLPGQDRVALHGSLELDADGAVVALVVLVLFRLISSHPGDLVQERAHAGDHLVAGTDPMQTGAAQTHAERIAVLAVIIQFRTKSTQTQRSDSGVEPEGHPKISLAQLSPPDVTSTQ